VPASAWLPSIGRRGEQRKQRGDGPVESAAARFDRSSRSA